MVSKSVTAALQDLDRCESLLKSMNQQLQSFQDWKALEQQLRPLQQARMHLAIAASASTAYQALLHLKGPSTEDRAHAKELARLEAYEKKVAQAESEKWLQEHKPSLSVDVAGANRFISAAIPELTSKQKHALHVAGRKLGGPAVEDHNASSSAAASQFLDSLTKSSGSGDIPLQRGGKQREPSGGAGPREHLLIRGAPMSKKEKRRLAKEVQRGAADGIHVKKKQKG